MRRDSERSLAYRAENAAEFWETGFGRTFESLADVQAFIDRVIRGAWWRNRFDARPIRVEMKRRGSTRSSAFRSARKIAFAPGHLTLAVVLHEMAHIAAPAGAHHGQTWRRVYLDLVRRFAPDFHDRLKESFRQNGLRTNRKAKRPNVSSARRETLARSMRLRNIAREFAVPSFADFRDWAEGIVAALLNDDGVGGWEAAANIVEEHRIRTPVGLSGFDAQQMAVDLCRAHGAGLRDRFDRGAIAATGSL